MPEHDAFGRPIGEDPLAALRGATEPDVARPAADPQPALTIETVAPAPEPASAPAGPPSAPGPASAPAGPLSAPLPRVQFVRPRRRPWRAVRALVIVIVLLSVAATVIPALVRVATDEVGDRLDELVPAPARPAADPPRGLQGASMIRRANFAEAVAELRGAELGRPVLVRVAPERVDATLVDRQGRVHQVQVTFDGTLNRFSTSAGSGNVPTVPFKAIEAGAPERLVRRGAKRAGAAAGTINYVAFTAGVDLPWGAYFKGGGIVQGDRSGTPRRVL